MFRFLALHSLPLILFSLAFAGEAVAVEPVVHLPLHEGAGVEFHSRGSSSVMAHAEGKGGTWTQDVPASFKAGSAWRQDGGRGNAVVLRGQQLPELAVLEDFTFTGWIRIQEVRPLSRIISKSLPKMEALFELRIDAESGETPHLTAALRTGRVAETSYPERVFELPSEPFTPNQDWMSIAIVRESESGLVTFYLAQSPEQAFQNMGSRKGPVGPISTEAADIVIGNSRLNMARTLNADFSDFRIYQEALEASQLEVIRQSALRGNP